MDEKKLLLFDFDGTVADNSQGIFNSVRYAADKHGFPAPDAQTLRRFVGPPLYESFSKYFGADHETALSMVASYRERYRPIGTTEAALYPDMAKMLSALQAEGYILAVCSGKPQEFVEKICRMLGVHGVFSGFYCPSLKDTSLEKADYILRAISDFGVTKAQTLMIGDTRSDIVAAKKAGVESVGAAYGFAAPGELEETGADHIVNDAKEMYTCITGRRLP